MPIGFDPNGPLRRKPASDGVEIAAKCARRRPASTPAGTEPRAVTRRRIVSICLLGSVLLGSGAIASVAPLTTTAFAGEARDAATAGVGRAEADEATAPKLGPVRRRGEEKGVVPSQADTRDQEKGIGNSPPAAPSMTCAEALASEPLQNMDAYLKDIGIRYEAIFDQALSGAGCTGRQVVDFLVKNGANLYDYDEYKYWNTYALRYRPGDFLRRIFIFRFAHIVIVEGKRHNFMSSTWNIGFI